MEKVKKSVATGIQIIQGVYVCQGHLWKMTIKYRNYTKK